MLWYCKWRNEIELNIHLVRWWSCTWLAFGKTSYKLYENRNRIGWIQIYYTPLSGAPNQEALGSPTPSVYPVKEQPISAQWSQPYIKKSRLDTTYYTFLSVFWLLFNSWYEYLNHSEFHQKSEMAWLTLRSLSRLILSSWSNSSIVTQGRSCLSTLSDSSRCSKAATSAAAAVGEIYLKWSGQGAKRNAQPFVWPERRFRSISLRHLRAMYNNAIFYGYAYIAYVYIYIFAITQSVTILLILDLQWIHIYIFAYRYGQEVLHWPPRKALNHTIRTWAYCTTSTATRTSHSWVEKAMVVSITNDDSVLNPKYS